MAQLADHAAEHDQLERRLEQEQRARAHAERKLEVLDEELTEALERLFTEAQLRHSSQLQLAEAIDHMSAGFVVYDVDDRLSLCNSRNRELYWESADLLEPGVHIEAILRASLERNQYSLDGEDPEAWLARRLERFRNPRGVHTEKLSNGRWIQISERKTDDGQTIGVRTDISELMRREEALRASEEKFRSVMNVARDAIIAADRQGQIVAWNQGATRIFGYTLVTVVGVSIHDLVARSARADLQTMMLASLTQEGAATTDNTREVTCRRRDGSEFPAEVAIANWGSKDGLFFSVVVRDISQRKTADAERSMLERKVRQMQKMEALGTLAGGTAHEFNNLLVPIIGLTEIVRDEVDPDSIEHDNLETVLQAAERARDLVARILSFSREKPTEVTEVDLKEVTVQSLGLLRNALPSTIVIRHRSTQEDVVVWGDIGELQQIVMNLASNAAYAIGDRVGHIAVELQLTDVEGQPPAGHDTLTPGRYACLRVSDTGAGMTRETAERIFEPFFTTKPVGEGTGLGLAMIHSIVTRADGSVSVDSTVGEGTTFEIMLPTIKPGHASAGDPRPATAADALQS